MLKSLLPYLQYGCQPRALLARLSVTTAAAAARTHYEVLGLQTSATSEDVKNAFRQKAKELHPDLNAAYTAADGEAFMQLVAAYEVLSDPEQRQLYDIASSSQLPVSLRRAAAAAAGSAGNNTASDAADTNIDPFGWRYGLSDWAKHGPGNDTPAMPADASDFRWSLLNALARHRKDLEHDLHTGLLKAFLGPKLEVPPGQLPPAFEADERAHPSLSHDLLHLVHGRTLLGVVRVQQPLQIAGDQAAAAAALPGFATQQLTAAGATHQGVTPADELRTSKNCTADCDNQLANTKPPPQLQQQAASPGDVAAPTAVATAAAATTAAVVTGIITEAAAAPVAKNVANNEAAEVSTKAAAAPKPKQHAEKSDKANEGQLTAATLLTDDEAEIAESEWQELLQKQHPLRCRYDWMPPPQLQLPAAPQPPVPPSLANENSVQHAGHQQTDDDGTGVQSSGGRDGRGAAAVGSAGGAHALHDYLTLGGQTAKQAWEDTWQRQHGCNAGARHQSLVCSSKPCQPAAEVAFGIAMPGSAGPVANAAASTLHTDTSSSSSSQSSKLCYPVNKPAAAAKHCCSVDPAAHATTGCSRASESYPQQAELGAQTQQHPQQQERYLTSETCGRPDASQQWHNNQQQEHWEGKHPRQQRQQQRFQQQARWLRQRRLWRMVRCPTPDWSAADWEFDDSSDKVLVLQLLMDGGRVAAVAVRDDKQPAKPTKVYMNGTFTVAILDDIVMEPLTGRLLGLLYKYYTPGVHHLYFYLPGTQGSRVLARLQRRWMPPSSTWLFPPVSKSHDRGGWVVEWEGHGAENKPGWMHPSVFVLTAGSYSYDMESRTLQSNSRSEFQAQLWQQASYLGKWLAQALRWLQVRSGGQT